MRWLALLVCGVLWCCAAAAQEAGAINARIVNAQKLPLSHASVALLKTDSSLVKISLSDSAGLVRFYGAKLPHYLLRVTLVGHADNTLKVANDGSLYTVTLHPADGALGVVRVSTRKPFVELKPNGMVINVENGITTVGTTALETLEKLPGIAVDKDGNLSLKGRQGVLVLIDGKQTYLGSAELAALLGSLSASQLSQVELMDIPPASLDAAGTAGVINLKLKKSTLLGFNGSLTTGYSQGQYPKHNHNVLLNYRPGRANYFLNYSVNGGEWFTRAQAVRRYQNPDGSFRSLLDQPSFLALTLLSHNLRAGLDYTLSKRSSLGLTLFGVLRHEDNLGNNRAFWKRNERAVDSVVYTRSADGAERRNGSASLNFRHVFSPTRELTADVDLIGYRTRRSQHVENTSMSPSRYKEEYRARIPTDIGILAGKVDYTERKGHTELGLGWKSSRTNTNNLSVYEYNDGGGLWVPDLGKSNHFLYDESIHALYGTVQAKGRKLSLQGGLRFEMTSYDAKELETDSSFSRNYNGLFPTVSLAYEKDSAHTFSFSAGRRINRPPYPKLNPFVFIINKYTYQQGNPLYRPEFAWNAELGHAYKNTVFTTLSYSVTTDFFAQIFPSGNDDIVIFTEGNLGRLQNLGASVSLQLSPAPWWSLSLQGVVNRKWMEGTVVSRMTAAITQYSVTSNNQFRFGKGWGGELNGYYHSASQQELQEVLDPYGQLSVGLAKSVAKNRGTLKLSLRDVFYTNWMRGVSFFPRSTETFDLRQDTRLAQVSFTWRFGKTYKTEKRSSGSAGDLIQRVGTD